MPSRHYNAVAFDVRENMPMLFFARTGAKGEIEDYLLIMRIPGTGPEEQLVIEVNDVQLPGSELVRKATMDENTLTLYFRRKVREFNNAAKLVVTFDNSRDNKACMERGAFRVLGDMLSCGHA